MRFHAKYGMEVCPCSDFSKGSEKDPAYCFFAELQYDVVPGAGKKHWVLQALSRHSDYTVKLMCWFFKPSDMLVLHAKWHFNNVYYNNLY